ncbi:MAG: nuclear transport factor 2 family protein [Chitinophagaceae bacterium]|nr:nuclear transport factor 2 family protein [Chitinophagaceae bacterium]
MNKLILLLFTLFVLFSCNTRAKKENEEDKTASLKLAILDTDRAFSAMSEEKGLRSAFIEFIDSNGVLLRPGTVPLTGGDAMDFITQSNDSTFTMTWEPRSADISSSGDLGYTYGLYSVQPTTGDSVIYGSYVTIWKRQPDGKWKFILQSGNEGVE